jgi:pseudomonalisin
MSSPFRTLQAFLSLPLLVVLALLSVTAPAIAQSPVPQTDRIAPNADLRSTTRISGHVPAWAVAANDAGPAPASGTLRLTFVLSRSAERQAAFAQLLADQQNPSSPSFHHWLTPQQIGALYGPTQNDLDALSAWLTGQGLQVREIAPSGLFLTAEAPVSTVANALAVNLRSFSLRDPASGQTSIHIATTSEPAIPSAFASVVSAIKGLSDAPVYAMHHTRLVTNGNGSAAAPQLTTSTGDHFITPNDFATLYGISASYQAGITGANQKVAIVGRSRVATSDITSFDTLTGLAANQPNVVVPPTGTDPGVTNTSDQDEATLDVERVLGTAPGAQVDLVVSTTTANSDGIEIGAQYEVQTLRDPILSISFGACEASAGSSGVTYWDSLFSQAAGEGISVFVSSGDAGVDGCEAVGTVPAATQTASINAICASSYATCVGGTEFADFADPSMYWSSTSGTGLESALMYIPEGAWNEPTATSGSTTVSNLSATGGGASTVIAKPTWQSGTGVPADAARDVPDVSFSASMHDGYLSCLAYTSANCTTSFNIFSGTSAAAPSMAGIAALLNQKAGAAQGNLNPLLYRLAATSSTTGAVHDVTPTTSDVALCELNTPSMCNNSIPGPTVGSLGLAGYAVTTGYDLATGLGSLQVTDFLTAATAPVTSPTPPPTNVPTSIGLTSSPPPNPSTNTTAISASQAVVFSSGVGGSSGAGTLSGTVQFYSNGAALGAPVALQGGYATSPPESFPTVGTYTITATYSGNSIYASSSASLKLVVTTAATATSVTTLSLASLNVPAGIDDSLTVTVASATGSGPVPTGYVELAAGKTTFAGPYQLTAGSVTTASAVTLLPAGATQITAMYLGDSNYLPSTSTPQTLTIEANQQTPVVVLTPQYNNIVVGGSETLTANVSGNGTHAPTGTLQFFEGTTSLATVPLVNGAATTAPLTFNTAGTFQMTAVYSGDANFFGATSAAVPITVTTGAPYQVSAVPSITLTAGATTDNSVTIAIQQTSAFVGNITLACTVAYNGTGTPNDMPTCAFQGNDFPIPGGPTNSLLTITTVAHQTTTAAVRVEHPFTRWGGLSVCSLLLCLVGPRRLRRVRHAIGVGALFALFVIVSGCGGASSGTSPTSSTPTPAATGTTAGSYTVTVTSTNTAGVPAPAPLTIALTVN